MVLLDGILLTKVRRAVIFILSFYSLSYIYGLNVTVKYLS